jgi:hypothetical protein
LAKLCNALGEGAIVLILALAIPLAASLSVWQSAVLFAFGCFFVLDVLRPPLRVLSLVLAGLTVVGAVAVVARFLAAFPLTASAAVVRERFLRSLLDPLPMIWLTLVAAGTLAILYRLWATALDDHHSPLEVTLLVTVSMLVFQLSLSLRWSFEVSETTFAVPYASLLLPCGLVCRWLASPGPAAPGVPARSLLLAAGLLGGLLLVPAPLLAAVHGLGAEHLLAPAGAVLGLVLFAVLVHAQMGVPDSRRRLRIAIPIILVLAALVAWSRVPLLPEVRPYDFGFF